MPRRKKKKPIDIILPAAFGLVLAVILVIVCGLIASIIYELFGGTK